MAEIRALEIAILRKLEEAGPVDPSDEAFVKFRFSNQLRNYWSWNGLYGLAFVAVTIGSLVTRLASSSIRLAGMGTPGRAGRSSFSASSGQRLD